jgi:uncharacterized integral membrane protein
MSDANLTLNDDPSQVGQTSADVEESLEHLAKKKSKAFNVWNAMLLVSMVCIIAACLLLVFELRNFSNFPFSYPWNTASANAQ